MEYTIDPASPGDESDILDVMRVWNMHHVPSPEMESLDLSCFFVARAVPTGQVIGAAGYRILSHDEGKTTLLGVYPECSGSGVGKALHRARLEAMYEAGVRRVTTNADRPETIVWYKKHFGYREVGTLQKLSSFGSDDVSVWTTLEMDLEEYFSERGGIERRRSEHVRRNNPPPLSPYAPLIINVCLTGMVHTKRSAPHLPVSVEEIVADAVAVHDAGAQIVHIHARDRDGSPTPSAEIYERIILGIRSARPALLCSVSTSGRNWSDFESRSEVLLLTGPAKPDLASLTLGSLNFLSGPSISSITTIERLAMLMKDRAIKAELEAFDLGMLNLAGYLDRHGMLPGPPYVNLILGNINSSPASIGAVASLVGALPERALWSAGALGAFQLPMNAIAIASGGHVRVGLEDDPYYDLDRRTPATNRDLVERVVRMADEIQRPLATPAQTRGLLGLT